MTNIDETPVDQLTYEQAFSQLEAIVTALEGDELTLEAAMSLYERGQKLIQHCNRLLEQAELRVRQLSGENLVDFEP
ncbi:MAG: exodeoxyribonuclease VII small subunit [Chloroflexi bacterium RBG_16_57_11]|nr:MAG: exodeoxyribonuclease VII small subunit [Chloroflexi bacterium RBG_16_57_11]